MQRYSLAVLILGVFTVIVAVGALIGWQLDVASLKSVLPWTVAMKANTALAVLLAAFSLLLSGLSRHAAARYLACGLAVLVGIIGLLTLIEYVFGLNFGIDQMWFREQAGAEGTLFPGRMALPTAINLVLLSGALLCANFRRAVHLAVWLALVVSLMGLLPLLGYLYGARQLITLGMYSDMSIRSAACFILLGIGIFLANSKAGFMGVITADNMSGWLLRRMLLFITGVPLLLGWMTTQAEAKGVIDPALATALSMVGLLLILAAMIYWSAQAVGRVDALRLTAQTDLRESNDYLTSLFDYANAPIIVWDPQFRITRFNRAFEKLTGRSAAPVTGHRLDLLFPPDQAAQSMQLIRRTLEGERWEAVEIPIMHLDGAVRTVLWNSATIFAADRRTPLATIAQGQDITERKQAEGRLDAVNEELSSANEDLTAVNTELVIANAELESSQRKLTRANRALHALDESGRALNRARDEQALLDKVCANLTEIGGYQ